MHVWSLEKKKRSVNGRRRRRGSDKDRRKRGGGLKRKNVWEERRKKGGRQRRRGYVLNSRSMSLHCIMSKTCNPQWDLCVILLPHQLFPGDSFQTTDNGGAECADSSAVPAVCCSAVPQQPRATAGPHPAAPGAALSAVHAAALPGPAGPATGTMHRAIMGGTRDASSLQNIL